MAETTGGIFTGKAHVWVPSNSLELIVDLNYVQRAFDKIHTWKLLVLAQVVAFKWKIPNSKSK